MIIANPLYDTAFKGLATDLDVAKAIIETLLETDVLDIQLGPTEHNRDIKDTEKLPRSLRMDYLAVVKTADGGSRKILIEMQKAYGSEALFRFREYLAKAGYTPQSGEREPLPILTIYFLGFKLRNVSTPCLKVSRQYIDMLNNQVLETKEKFVELLTHDSFIIQAPRIKLDTPPQTKLEKILSVFKQDNFVDIDEGVIDYKYPIEDAAVKKMVDILHYYATDPEERKKMEEEAYWERYDYHTVGQVTRLEEEARKKDAALAEKDAALAEKDAALAEKDAALAEKDAAHADEVSRLLAEIERLKNAKAK